MLLLALMVAVLSLTAVGFFTSRISQGVRAAGRRSAGGGSAAGIARSHSRSATSPRRGSAGLRSARVVTFPTAIFSGDAEPARGAQRGDAGLSAARPRAHRATRRSARARVTDRIPGRGEVWIDARIMAQLKIALGATLRIGAASFRVTEVLDYRPDQGTGFVNLAPAVLHQLRRRGIDPADPARQPRDLRGPVRRAAGGGRRVPRILESHQGAG